MKLNVDKIVFNLTGALYYAILILLEYIKIGIKTIFRLLFSKLKVQFSGESAIIKDSTINGNLVKKNNQ
nr:MAG TPA: hypothetical protein [Caudoviricetes sp.]